MGREEKEEGGDWMNAVLREVLYASARVRRGSIVGEKMAIGAPPERRGILWRRIEMGSICDAIASPENPPESVECTMDVMRLCRRSLR